MLHGQNVAGNGSLAILVPVNPLLLILPYLKKYAKDDYMPLRSILLDDEFPAVKLLEKMDTVISRLKHICYCHEISGVKVFRYDEQLLLSYLTRKLKCLEKTAGPEFGEAIYAILEDNVSADILDLLEQKEDVPPSGFRKRACKFFNKEIAVPALKSEQPPVFFIIFL
ncbi:unnamed protein product [Gongylonema pulchrum]|uniref:RNase_H2-Ydr279 domain-containing protein n=1 Tax=Gongylonema pulchrum TaxID=637853 RepID=A0A183CXZ2_9BILA|nr:unnamed protein product [Gongylonema pulchrum]